MKGVLLFDDFEGVWLIHSIPFFPLIQTNKYIYPESGKRNGQTVLCITFKTANLNDIGIFLMSYIVSCKKTLTVLKLKNFYINTLYVLYREIIQKFYLFYYSYIQKY